MKKRVKKKKHKKKRLKPRDPNVSSGVIFSLKSGLPNEDKKLLKKKMANKSRRREDKNEECT